MIPERREESRAERLADATVHVIGIVAAGVAVPVLLVLTALLRGDAAAMIATGIYGLTLILMILCSALYNMVTRPDWKPLLRRFDHSAIYFKIAGTYTPFAVMSGQGLALLAGLWAAALAGSCLRVFAPDRMRLLAYGLYLAMGWAGLVAGRPLLAELSEAVLFLIVLGGCLYTGGIVFHLWRRMLFQNAVWHVFVLVASAVFYLAVLLHVQDV